jgi:sarcosine oxidase subunit gamma
LVKALDGIHSLAVDVSDMRAIFRLEGDNARVVLNKGTSVDFTDGTLGVGTVRRLRYAEIAAAVHVVSDAPCVMHMYLFRSYADYAWSYLSKTAAKASELKLFGPQVGISA